VLLTSSNRYLFPVFPLSAAVLPVRPRHGTFTEDSFAVILSPLKRHEDCPARHRGTSFPGPGATSPLFPWTLRLLRSSLSAFVLISPPPPPPPLTPITGPVRLLPTHWPVTSPLIHFPIFFGVSHLPVRLIRRPVRPRTALFLQWGDCVVTCCVASVRVTPLRIFSSPRSPSGPAASLRSMRVHPGCAMPLPHFPFSDPQVVSHNFPFVSSPHTFSLRHSFFPPCKRSYGFPTCRFLHQGDVPSSHSQPLTFFPRFFYDSTRSTQIPVRLNVDAWLCFVPFPGGEPVVLSNFLTFFPSPLFLAPTSRDIFDEARLIRWQRFIPLPLFG